MTGWAKYSKKLRRALYDDNADVSDLCQAADAIGFDFVEEDKPRLEHLCRTHPNSMVRSTCLLNLLTFFSDAAWVPYALDLLADDEMYFGAWDALLRYLAGHPDTPGILQPLAQAVLDRRAPRYGDWSEESMIDLLRVLKRPKLTTKEELFAEAERLARSGP